MTREELSTKALEESKKHKTIVLQWSTGAGKSKGAIDIINYNMGDNPRVLLLISQSVHAKTWKEQLDTWKANFKPIIACYASLHKFAGQTFDYIIADEAQHFSELKRSIFDTIKVNNNFIVLSATLPFLVKEWLGHNHKAVTIALYTHEAIKSSILPDPRIIKVPLRFDSLLTETIVLNPPRKGESKPIKLGRYNKKTYWSLKSNKKVCWKLSCSKQEYYTYISELIDWYKRRHRDVLMLKESTNRLTWLAYRKTDIVKQILEKTKSYRSITFCTDISQAEILGSNCIHSKNKKSTNEQILDAFNNEKIDHITACHMLDESANLANCKVGIFANLNASDIMFIQRVGRVLRHKEPVIIIPYFVGTRDEELVNKHLGGYNPDLITTITNINNLKL